MSAIHTSGLKVLYKTITAADDAQGKDFKNHFFAGISSAGGTQYRAVRLMPVVSIESKKNPIVTLAVVGTPKYTDYLAGSDATGKFQAPAEGMIVRFESAMGVLSGKYFQVGKVTPESVVGGAKFELIGADTTGLVIDIDPLKLALGATKPSLFLTHLDMNDLSTLCPTSIDVSTSAPGTTNIGTFCDPTLSIAATDGSAGTVTISGHLSDEISALIGIMDQPKSTRADIIDVAIVLGKVTTSTTPFGSGVKSYYRGDQGAVFFRGRLVSYDLDVPLDGVLGYSFTIELEAKPEHIF